MGDEDSDLELPVAIINEDTELLDPMASFPYFSEGENPVSAVNRVSRYFQFGTPLSHIVMLLLTSTDPIPDDGAFIKLRDWMDNYMWANRRMDSFYECYARNRDFWANFPDIIWALSWRR